MQVLELWFNMPCFFIHRINNPHLLKQNFFRLEDAKTRSRWQRNSRASVFLGILFLAYPTYYLISVNNFSLILWYLYVFFRDCFMDVGMTCNQNWDSVLFFNLMVSFIDHFIDLKFTWETNKARCIEWKKKISRKKNLVKNLQHLLLLFYGIKQTIKKNKAKIQEFLRKN